MEKKSEETMICDICKESSHSEFVTPYIIFPGHAFSVPNYVEYFPPMSFNMCFTCFGKVSIDEIFKKLANLEKETKKE